MPVTLMGRCTRSQEVISCGSPVSAHLVSRGTKPLCSRLAFWGCWYREQPCRAENESPSQEADFFPMQHDKVKPSSESRTRGLRVFDS